MMHRFESAFRVALVEALDRRLLLAAAPVLVKDINTATDRSIPSALTEVNGAVYFVASDGGPLQDTLWRSDGTAAGTTLLKNFSPEPGTQGFVGELAGYNGRLFFSASEPDGTDFELWSSDGTPAGTARFMDLAAGSASSYPSELTTSNGALFFVANGHELWKTDGTAAGTARVADLFTGAEPDRGSVYALTDVNGTLFLQATSPDGVAALWKSDGTEAGTTQVKTLPATVGASFTETTASNGRLFFVAGHPDGGLALWKSDGTEAGTVPLKQFPAGSDFNPRSLFDFGGVVLFGGSDVDAGMELWRSDGTEAGTVLLKDIEPGENSSMPGPFTLLNGTVYFPVYGGNSEIWKTDGTEAGTVLAVDVLPGPEGSSPTPLVNLDGKLYFAAHSKPAAFGFGSDRELWRTDGTQAGTVRVADVSPGPTSSNPDGLTAAGGRLFFAAEGRGDDRELWVTDGTAAGTVQLADINRAPLGSAPDNLLELNGVALLTVRVDSEFRELWRTDGTASGTRRLGDVYVSGFDITLAANGTVFFIAYQPQTGWELWKTDGTDAGTVIVKDLIPGPEGSRPVYISRFGDGVVFSPLGSGDLWKSDGTDAGTVRVSGDANPVSKFVTAGGFAYFAGHSMTAPLQSPGLWKTDGTAAGTVRVSDGFPEEIVAAGDKVFFRKDALNIGTELWVTDGTTEGTSLVKDIRPFDRSSSPHTLTAMGNVVMFFAFADDSGNRQLWRSDGTAGGTFRVGPNQSSGWDMQRVGDWVYYAVWSNGDYDLWKSDGTNAWQVKQFDGFNLGRLTDVGGTLYFMAATPETGEELWKSDGTAEGTAPVADVWPGPDPSWPDQMTLLNGHMLLFSAIHPDVGQELWRIDLPGVAGRHLFYNGSRADGGDLGADARDDAAIATGKVALRGGNATFANVTNYVRGINGIMVDVSALPEGVTPTADDFTFRAFTPGGPVGGTPVAPPGAITVRRGAGASGTDRVTLVWSDAAVRNGWLQVTVKANGRTGLTAPDTFVFGNLVGDTGGPGLRVDAADVLGTRLHLGHTDAAALDRYDFSRDGRINPQDLMIARMSWARALALPSAPAASVAAASVLPTAPTSRSARRPIVRGILSDGADNLLS